MRLQMTNWMVAFRLPDRGIQPEKAHGHPGKVDNDTYVLLILNGFFGIG